MWNKIIQIAKTVSSMLHSGEIPPNTPIEYQKDLSKVNFLASKKFFVVFCSVIILSVFYAVSIFVLFLTSNMSATITSAFVTIFVETIKILAVIIGSYLGVQTLLDFKYKSDSNTEFKSENKTEKIEEITIITTNVKENDYQLQ
jgi:ABC-type Na+ efflux pump permease subunit